MAKIILNVPDNEFGVDIQNKFHDFFGRVKVEIETRVEVGDTLMCGAYEIETAEMFLNAFKEMKIIPDNATNGDIYELVFGKKVSKNSTNEWWNKKYEYNSN